MGRIEWVFYLLIPASILIHVFVAPYTKVEESFNIQAIHDILIHGIPNENAEQFFTANYDHISFPGSVPRTFAGALILSGLSRPWIWLVRSPQQLQLLVRSVLGLLNAAALVYFGQGVQRAFGRSAAVWYALFQSSQFHIIYYASRTLPNMFAFVFSTIALKGILDAHSNQFKPGSAARSYRLSLYLLTFAGVVFRSELAILVGTLTIYLLATRPISIPKVIIPAGLGGLVMGLLCTIPIDSYFWQSFPLWPEWIAFYYNTIEGHSADWGTSPWHFYLINALPRLLLNPLTYLLCVPVALVNPVSRQRSLDLLIPLLSFVGLYSFLPHKEWRFVIYVIPGLTAVAAAGAAWISTRSAKSGAYKLLTVGLIGSIVLSFAASTALLGISSLNYPGGEALTTLHHQLPHPEGRPLRVYLDNLACQTGVTRFLEVHNGPQTVMDVLEAQDFANHKSWGYSKTEDPEVLLDPRFWDNFDYVLAERPEKVIGSWEVVHTVYGFSGISFLRPGEGLGKGSTTDENAAAHYTDRVAAVWATLEEKLRYPLLRGYWVKLNMQPKIRILARRPIGI
ncbi:glycosyltransferase family 22 protein [Aaosphaeria arxii CBS 175.79]|uniref:Mannosyltransferase n=1 Tax=Aaosphaeria arxii CBS 175.79 TaxID=1450172 RepID=A0A6A5XJW8_9PLEO|nr:glycosyltransferase family 22 protein [Aaosphaeria arxii CBS 175.79]KAF2013169.1 glycosyltransferase family 22 protein [Aaosphaeria arxii CBS 175.79]